jgi:hypothetical protein
VEEQDEGRQERKELKAMAMAEREREEPDVRRGERDE